MTTTTVTPENELALARVLTERETRELVGLSESTTQRLKEEGDYITPTELSERRIGYRLLHIIEWLDKRRRTDTFQQIGAVAQRVVSNLEGDR